MRYEVQNGGAKNSLDGSSVIGDTVTNSTEVLDVTENLVATGVVVERRDTLVLDGLEPVGIVGAGSAWSEGSRARGSELSSNSAERREGSRNR